MGAVKILDTNTVFESVKLCMCGKKYEVDKTKIFKYSLEIVNGQFQLIFDGKIIPLVEIKE